MTANDDFIPDQSLSGETSGYPTAFGITFTPIVIGAIVAVVGLAVASYLVVSQVLPAWDAYNKLKDEVASKQDQAKQQKAIEKKLDEARVNLDNTKQVKREVMALFSSEKTLDTLLMDVNSTISPTQGQLTTFLPVQQPATVDANNKLKRKVYTLNFQGTFDQTLSALQKIERLPLLLEVKDLRVDLGGTLPQRLQIDQQGRVVTIGQPTLRNSLKLQAVLPLTPEENAQLAAAATPPKK